MPACSEFTTVVLQYGTSHVSNARLLHAAAVLGHPTWQCQVWLGQLGYSVRPIAHNTTGMTLSCQNRIDTRGYLKLLDCLAGATGERRACCLTLLLLALLLQGLSARLQLKLRMLKACVIQVLRLRKDVCAALSPKAMNEYRPVQDCECELAVV